MDINVIKHPEGFTTVIPSFRRFLCCPQCGFEKTLTELYSDPVFKLQWKDLQFVGYCPICNYNGIWKVIDYIDKSKPSITKRWNPRELQVKYNPLTGTKKTIWCIPEVVRNLIRNGYSFILNDTPMSIIDTIRNNCDFEFDNKVILSEE